MLTRSLQVLARTPINQRLLISDQLNKELFSTRRHLCVTTKLQATKIPGKDNGNILVYEGPLSSRIRHAKIFSLSSSAIGLAMQPVLYQKTLEAGTGLAVTIGGAVFLGFFTFVTPVLLHLVSRKYVTHLFYNPSTEEFTASTYNIFLRPKVTVFKADDVTRPELPTMFASFYVRGKPLFADPENFTSLEVYKKMMGYDKPIDMKLSNKTAEIK
uniref:Transmembrane protein 70 homolog, mitochondrial n=1 Tax=Cacopsylla melanoneura TaxID=428564 RepID=A0A8D8Y705_9HEMI